MQPSMINIQIQHSHFHTHIIAVRCYINTYVDGKTYPLPPCSQNQQTTHFKTTMCPQTKVYKHYLDCGSQGHKLPLGACNKYAHGLKMCLDDPIKPKKFDFQRMEDGGVVHDQCSFCKQRKDIDGDYLYGKLWEGTARHREGKR